MGLTVADGKKKESRRLELSASSLDQENKGELLRGKLASHLGSVISSRKRTSQTHSLIDS
jgi:hypothetical protein